MFHDGETQVHFQVTLGTLVKKKKGVYVSLGGPELTTPPGSSLTPIKVRGLSGLSDKNTSQARREPLSHLFEEEKQQGVFICTWVYGRLVSSSRAGLPGSSASFKKKNKNKTQPLKPLSRSFQEKRSVLTLLGVHMGENQACSLTERECQGVEAKVRPGGGEADRPWGMASVRHVSPSVHLNPARPLREENLDIGWAKSFSQETLKITTAKNRSFTSLT